MNRTLALTTTAALLVGLVASGCDRPPAPPKLAGGETIKVLQVDAGDAEELEAVKAAEGARVNYEYRLTVLEAYYKQSGDLVKLRWARREADNLSGAQVFRWERIEAVPPKGESLAGADERVLVESTVAARKDWTRALAGLVDLYERRGDPGQDIQGSLKLRAVRNVQQRLDPVRTYMYFLDAEIPGPQLRPAEVVPDADRMYQEAIRLHKKGKGALRIFATTVYADQRKALKLLREVIAKHPRSTRIALCAYYIAEIYKEYFNEDIRAVNWYRRAWQWDPYIIEPARFQAATIYDHRLQEKQEAVECYRMAIKNDPWRLWNAEYAQDRIAKLTRPKNK